MVIKAHVTSSTERNVTQGEVLPSLQLLGIYPRMFSLPPSLCFSAPVYKLFRVIPGTGLVWDVHGNH